MKLRSSQNLNLELGIGLLTLTALVGLVVAQAYWMPSSVIQLLLVVVTVGLSVYVSFIWRAKPRDEREEIALKNSGHVSFLSGASVLLVAIIVESRNDTLSVWIPIALLVMIASKIIVDYKQRLI